MTDYQLKTTVSDDGSITIPGLPFKSGDRVEVIVRKCKGKAGRVNSSRPKPVSPFDGVDDGDRGFRGGSRRGSAAADF
jgi:hypothetical protein